MGKRIDSIKKRVSKFANSNGFVKFVLSLIMWAIALIPMYIGIFFFWLLGPTGFWQNIVTFIALTLVLGGPQILLGFIAGILTIGLIASDL